jgi:hypothetical protein
MIESNVVATPLRRSFDRSQRRKPLRLGISRRLARTGSGAEQFVTQVRLGKASAVLLPWQSEQHSEQP